ncbi:cytochrome P450 [Sphingomonas sp. QA11]|uniref:cytochrome P450 n=1 Tax=Sphingomonas sp. QA11 TaxID=2950605 RepID=UPI00234A8B95|nr:cytochrome P450 [Sphingomonas sp. QA11]WCM26968.1 cytochrome P450 [Sphingomonas sp. QA11]
MTGQTGKQSATDLALAAAHGAGRLRFNAEANRWLLTSFDGARAMVADQSFHLTPVTASAPRPDSGAIGMLLQRGTHLQALWHESHMRIRPVAASALKPGALAGLDTAIRARARRLIEAAIASQAGDLEAAFVMPLVGDTFMDLLGVPESRRTFVLRCGTMFGGFFGHGATMIDAAMAQASVGQFFERLLREPPAQGAVILQTAQAGLADGALTGDEAVTLLSDLLFGSMHATPVTLAFLLGQLTDPALRQAIVGGETSIETVIDEAARLRSARYPQGRVSTREVRLDGETIPAGARFGLDYDAINRDPDRFASPRDFDPDRRDADAMAFGGGMHRCVGRHLARIELRIGAETFLDAVSHLSVEGLARLAALTRD